MTGTYISYIGNGPESIVHHYFLCDGDSGGGNGDGGSGDGDGGNDGGGDGGGDGGVEEKEDGMKIR